MWLMEGAFGGQSPTLTICLLDNLNNDSTAGWRSTAPLTPHFSRQKPVPLRCEIQFRYNNRFNFDISGTAIEGR
jgi:hypothetical protein